VAYPFNDSRFNDSRFDQMMTVLAADTMSTEHKAYVDVVLARSDARQWAIDDSMAISEANLSRVGIGEVRAALLRGEGRPS
jgi:hypothetical protein